MAQIPIEIVGGENVTGHSKQKQRIWSYLAAGSLICLLCLSGCQVQAGSETVTEYVEMQPYRSEAEAQVTDTQPQKDNLVQEATKEPDSRKFAALKKVNPDFVGWIHIPDTKISYPIVQTDDNEKYLHTGFQGEENAAGSIFLDYESRSDLSGQNNIIYGHNMKNGTMFRDLLLFKDREFFETHRRFTLYTPEREISLKAIACYYGVADADIRRTDFENQEEFEEFVRRVISPCTFAEYPDRPIRAVYTLVTCSYEINDARTYLIAVEEEG